MRLVLGREIATIDNLAGQIYGIGGLQLMENAGRAVADHARAIVRERGLGSSAELLLFAGGGNNGGDALVAARHLLNDGYAVKLLLLAAPESYRGDALVNWQIVDRLDIPCLQLDNENSDVLLRSWLERSDLVVDGIFGTGFHGVPDSRTAAVIEQINQSGKPVLAIDLPSGVNANNGAVLGAAVRADYTVTFGWAKYGMRVAPGCRQVGRLTVADIGLPEPLLAKIDSSIAEVDDDFMRSVLPERDSESHKGSYGHVAVIGGSRGMIGAPILATGGALKSGVGLVTLASVAEVMVPLAANFPEAMCLPLDSLSGRLTLDNRMALSRLVDDKVAVVGMGMGRSEETQELIWELCDTMPRALVLDADALYAVAQAELNFSELDFPVVLTPHPGEMAALLGCATAEVQLNRMEAVSRAAWQYGAIVVLKGANTLTAVPEAGGETTVYLNTNGNPGMAGGGSGDVLSGVIGSLVAQGISPGEAAAAAVHLHGAAGDLAAAELGEYGMTASDLIRFLPYAIRQYRP